MDFSRTGAETETQLLRSSLQFRFLNACLNFGWIACVISLLTTVIWFPTTRMYVEGGGVIGLVVLFLALRYVAMPKVRSLDQLDYVTLSVIAPSWALAISTLFLSETENSLATGVMLTAFAAVLFYRESVFWTWYVSAAIIFVCCRYLSDKPMTQYDWAHLALLMPMLSIIFRMTVNGSFRELVKKNRERSRLVQQLSATVEKLRQKESETAQSKLELLAKDARLNAILDGAPLFLWCIDEQDKITEIRGNVIHEHIGTPSQLIGKSYRQVFVDCPQLIEAIEQFRHDGGSKNIRVTCTEGNYYEILLEKHEQQNGNKKCVIGVGFDVTQSVKADQQKMDLQQTLFHVQKMESLGLLAGGVAHDFNNYLMAIVAFAESLSGRGIDDVSVEKIKETALQASSVCDQLLVYSGKPSADVFRKEPVELNELVRDVQPLIRAVVPNEIELDFDFDSRSSFVRVIKGQIHQVVINMIKNSVEAIGKSNDGRVIIRTNRHYEKSESAQRFGKLALNVEYCQLELRDNGIGILPENLTRIADLYFTTKINGHGFGMAVAARLIEDHGGCMEVESIPGEGSVVRIVLPTQDNEAMLDDPVGKEEDSALASDSSTNGFHVLLVDDEPAVLEAVQLVLQSRGHTVSSANSAQQAIEMLDQYGDLIECIVSDFSMPQMNGIKFGDAIRSNGWNQPFVLCSGYSLPVDNTANEFVPDLVLMKPYQPKVLDEIIRKMCVDSAQIASVTKLIQN